MLQVEWLLTVEPAAVATASEWAHAEMGNEQNQVTRKQVGFLVLVCFAGAVGGWLSGAEGLQTLANSCLRVGIVLAAVWLAMPTRDRPAAWANVSPWTLVGIVVAVILLTRIPFRIFLPLFAVLALLGYVLRPRGKRRASSRK